MKGSRNIKMDMGFSSCPQKNRSGWYWLVSHQLDFATHPGVLVAIFFLSPICLSIWLSIHRITLTGYDTRSHLLSFLRSRRIANLCQSLFPPRLPPQATEAGPADRQMLNSKCSPYALRRPLSNCDCCSGCSSHQTIRFQATFTGSRCAAAQGHDTTRVYTARSVAGKHARRNSSNKLLSQRSPRRRPASVSNCCRRPEIPTADSRPRSSVLLKSCLLKNVC